MASTSLWSVWSIALPFLFTGCGSGNGVAAKTPDSVSQPDFSVTIPPSVTVTPNSTQTISISIAEVNGFSGAVNWPSRIALRGESNSSDLTLSPNSQQDGAEGARFGRLVWFSQTVVITAGNNANPGPVPLP